MPRKTHNVRSLVVEANMLLALPDNETINASFRAGVQTLVERVLMDTDNYKGFQYLPSEFTLPDNFPHRVLREDHDRTRVRYYAPGDTY